jgi:hypothetical protein
MRAEGFLHKTSLIPTASEPERGAGFQQKVSPKAGGEEIIGG